MPSPTPIVAEVHRHLSDAMLSLADAIPTIAIDDRAELLEVARLLTTAQSKLSVISKTWRGDTAVES